LVVETGENHEKQDVFRILGIRDELFLAEIYIVGTDGYFFKGEPGKHKHLVVKESIE
jgi:hypothetical protein